MNIRKIVITLSLMTTLFSVNCSPGENCDDIFIEEPEDLQYYSECVTAKSFTTFGVKEIIGLSKLISIKNYMIFNTTDNFLDWFDEGEATSCSDYDICNNKLEKIDAFHSLKKVGGAIELYDNPNLTSISGFENIESAGNVTCCLNEDLKTNGSLDFTLFENLKEALVNNELYITNSFGGITIKGGFESIKTFENLENVDHDILIAGKNISTLPEFPKLKLPETVIDFELDLTNFTEDQFEDYKSRYPDFFIDFYDINDTDD